MCVCVKCACVVAVMERLVKCTVECHIWNLHHETVRKLDKAVKTSNLSHKVSSGYIKTTNDFTEPRMT